MPPTRRQRALVLALLVLLPVILTAAPAVGNYQSVRDWSETVTSRSVTMLLPAVGESPDGELFGVIMEVEATTRTGTGGVYVDTRPLTQLDMQGSARLAAATAAGISAAPFEAYDFFIHVRSPAPTVGGPSAGAAITVAFSALLLDLPVRADVVMTGMVNPDLSIGPVGGILLKAQAAHEAGASLFLVPEGQRIVRQVELVEVEGADPPRLEPEERLIDVIEHAEAEWGLTVREIGDVYDAIEAATDHHVERPEPPTVVRSPVFDEVMGEAARAHLERAEDLRTATLTALNESGLAASQPDAHAQIEAILETGTSRLVQAQTAYAADRPYTASSRAFQAAVEITRAGIWIETLTAPDGAAFLSARAEALTQTVASAREAAAAAPVTGLGTLEAVGAAQVRAMEATRLLEQAAAAGAAGRIGEGVQALAFAEERTASVTWWIDMAEALAARVPTIPIEGDLGVLAREYRAVARDAFVYADVLRAQATPDSTQHQLMDRARGFLDDAQRAHEAGLTLGSLYLAIEAQVAAHAALSLLGSDALVDDRLERQAHNALLAVAGARAAGVEPFLAASFYEFAPDLEEQDPLAALLMYANAASIAALTRALATGQACPLAIVCAPEPPAVTRIGFGEVDPWTAYFALAAILFGFLAGALVTLVVVRRGTPAAAAATTASKVVPARAVVTSRRGAALASHDGGHAPGNGHAPTRAPPGRPAALAPPVVAVRRPRQERTGQRAR